jgi:dihydrodipicolinate synthase
MLLHARERDPERLRELGDRRAAVAETFEDASTRRVGKCRERPVDRRILNHTVHYSRRRLPRMLGEVLTAIVTPFRADGSVDVEAFRELAAHLVDNGSDGLVVAGTTGESPTLSDDEKLELFAAAVDAVGDRATVVAGHRTYDTRHSAELTKRAHAVGVDGFLAVTPYYNKPPQRAIVRHFQEIAAATDKPVVVYNIPSRVVVNIESATIARLADEIPNVAAVKQAHDDLDEARFIAAKTRLDLYAGDDVLVFPFLQLGGVGGVCVHTHIWGPQTKEMVRRFKDGDVDGAAR